MIDGERNHLLSFFPAISFLKGIAKAELSKLNIVKPHLSPFSTFKLADLVHAFNI
jgi:hypothetical protein